MIPITQRDEEASRLWYTAQRHNHGHHTWALSVAHAHRMGRKALMNVSNRYVHRDERGVLVTALPKRNGVLLLQLRTPAPGGSWVHGPFVAIGHLYAPDRRAIQRWHKKCRSRRKARRGY